MPLPFNAKKVIILLNNENLTAPVNEIMKYKNIHQISTGQSLKTFFFTKSKRDGIFGAGAIFSAKNSPDSMKNKSTALLPLARLCPVSK